MRYIKIFFCLIIVYILFGMAACLLPDKPIHRHIEQTVQRGELMYNDYPKAIINGEQARMDNFTDALIISQAWNCSKDSLWESVMQPSRAVYSETMTEALSMQVEGKQFCNKKYGRYWHGSTFLMRFMLLFWSYNNIRILFYTLSLLLIMFALWRLKDRIGTWAAVITLLSFALMYGYVMQFSIQFLPVLVLSIVGVIIMLDEQKDQKTALFTIGSLTAYFDLLTTPLLTLGIPLIAWILVHRNDKATVWNSFLEILKLSLVWGIAFAATWGFKWLLATLTTDENIWLDAMNNVAHRSNNLDNYSRIDALIENFNLLNTKFIIIVTLMLTIIMAFHFRSEGWRSALQLLFVALIPYVWYLVVANHSYEHFWFTYRLQMISILALYAALGCMVDWNNVQCGFRLSKRKKNK